MLHRRPRRYNLRMMQRHADARRRRRQLRQWLRGLVLWRIPEFGDMG